MKTPIEEKLYAIAGKRRILRLIADKGALSLIHEILTKEKEQIDELIKEICIESYQIGAECGEMFKNENRCFKSDAEQYYNEVIKPKL